MTNILTGFPNLDSLIGGLQQADMLLLTSPSATEDINLALSIILNTATNAHHRIGLLTLAMNKHQVVQRLLALSTGIELHRIRTGSLTLDECTSLARTAKELSHTKIWMDDRSDMSVLQVQQRAQAMVNAYDIALLVIDNIHCIQPTQNHKPEMGTMNETLQMLAKALNIPVLVLASHIVLKKNSHRVPTVSAQQGEYKQTSAAEHVLFLYRENVSSCDAQYKCCAMIPLLILNHRNGFVTDLTPSSPSWQPTFPDEVHIPLPLSQNDAAS